MAELHRPGSLYWKKLEPIADSVSIYDGPEIFLQQFSTIPTALGNLLAAHWCHSEITNGGFFQFFHNSTGVLAPEAAEAFKALGLDGCARVIEKAMAYLGMPYPREREKRLTILAGTKSDREPGKDLFQELDNEFYSLLPWQDDTFENAADRYASLYCG